MAILIAVLTGTSLARNPQSRSAPGPLDPQGNVHIPIGIANTVDALKTFVEAEGCFSPGVGSYGLYFWMYDLTAGKLTAPTMPDVRTRHGLTAEGYLIPWTTWKAGGLDVRTEVCHVEVRVGTGTGQMVAARAHLTNPGTSDRKVMFYAAVRAVGPAGCSPVPS